MLQREGARQKGSSAGESGFWQKRKLLITSKDKYRKKPLMKNSYIYEYRSFSKPSDGVFISLPCPCFVEYVPVLLLYRRQGKGRLCLLSLKLLESHSGGCRSGGKQICLQARLNWLDWQDRRLLCVYVFSALLDAEPRTSPTASS